MNDNNTSLLRKALIILSVFIVLFMIVLMLYLSDLLFRVYDSIKNSSPIFLVFYFLILGAVLAVGAIFIWKTWRFGRGPVVPTQVPPRATTVAELQKEVDNARTMGLDVTSIEEDIEALKIEPQELDVAFFGKISTGKSSLIRTLVPNAIVDTSIIGGSTSVVESYFYENENGLRLKLLDMPGIEQAGTLDEIDNQIITIARRGHIVVYVIDQDLTASDKRAIDCLHAFGKPMIVALNKINHYSNEERAELRQQIIPRLPTDVRFVEVESVYIQTVRRVDAQGNVTWQERFSKGNVEQLLQALASLAGERGFLIKRNQEAIIHLTEETLRKTVNEQRAIQGQAIVKTFKTKAIVGGMAAVGPGSDILIQGYLGMAMLKKFAELYGIQAKEIDYQSVINAATKQLKSNLTVGLMLGGNICKAFPGIGTVVGGLSHAAAYGFIFESFGNATLYVLSEKGERDFNQNLIANAFAKELNRDVEARVKNILKIALKEKKS